MTSDNPAGAACSRGCAGARSAAAQPGAAAGWAPRSG